MFDWLCIGFFGILFILFLSVSLFVEIVHWMIDPSRKPFSEGIWKKDDGSISADNIRRERGLPDDDD